MFLYCLNKNRKIINNKNEFNKLKFKMNKK